MKPKLFVSILVLIGGLLIASSGQAQIAISDKGVTFPDDTEQTSAAILPMNCPHGDSIVWDIFANNWVCETDLTPPPPGCFFVNGLAWCQDDILADQSCISVCEAKGLTPIADDNAWFEAQNTLVECLDIRNAFGYFSAFPNVGSFATACTAWQEDFGFNCSTNASCPTNHRVGWDQGFTSQCPCEGTD